MMKTKSRDIRFSETAKIMNYAFSNFKKEQLFDKNYQIKGKESVPVTKGKEDQVQIQTEEELVLTIKNGEKEAYKPKLVLDKEKLNEDGELTAPIEKGETIGYVTVEYENEDDIRFITQDGNKQIQVPVVAAESVEKANWFVLSMRGIGGFFGDLFSTVASTVKGLF